jgi:hypothetical protein
MLKLLDPETSWDAIEPRLGDPGLPIALLTLAIVGALGIAGACEIGVRFFNTDWDFVLGYAYQRDRGWKPFFGVWIALAIMPLVQGLLAAALMKIYSRAPRWRSAIAAATVGWIPMYVAGVSLVFLPGILLFAIAFVASCGWWVTGTRRLLDLGYSESTEHVAVSLMLTGALMLLVPAVGL